MADGGFRAETSWDLPDDFFAGAEVRLLEGGDSVSLSGYRAATGLLEPSSPLPGLATGAGFEISIAAEAPILAARLVTRTPLDRPLPPMALRLATTRGTNALLERRGAPTVLFVTAGLRDLLEIGTQQRPDLFALRVKKAPPLAAEMAGRRYRLWRGSWHWARRFRSRSPAYTSIRTA